MMAMNNISIKAKMIRNILQQKPIMTVFNVTNQCNERCKMCNIWKETSHPMPIEKIERYAEKLAEFGIGYVYLQGGEPLIRKDIIDIVDIFLNQGIHPTLITNGLLLTQEIAGAIAARNCNLSISIDTMDGKKYENLRGGGGNGLAIVKKNIKDCMQSISEHKGNWAITTTITGESRWEDIKNIERFAKRYGFMYAIRPYVAVKGVAGKKDKTLQCEKEKALQIFQKVYRKAKRENYLASLVYLENMKYIKGEKLSECDAMKYSFILKETGEFFPCLELPECEFNIEHYKNARKKYGKCIAHCSTNTPCYWNCSRTIGVLVRNKWKIAIHLPQILMQMQKYGNYF